MKLWQYVIRGDHIIISVINIIESLFVFLLLRWWQNIVVNHSVQLLKAQSLTLVPKNMASELFRRLQGTESAPIFMELQIYITSVWRNYGFLAQFLNFVFNRESFSGADGSRPNLYNRTCNSSRESSMHHTWRRMDSNYIWWKQSGSIWTHCAHNGKWRWSAHFIMCSYIQSSPYFWRIFFYILTTRHYLFNYFRKAKHFAHKKA